MKNCVCITGAAGGLGRAFAAECASRGWDLFLTDISQDRLESLAAGLARHYGVTATCYPCELTDPLAREALWRHIDEQGLRFHMLINVAGLEYEGLFAERSLVELLTIVRVTVEATVEMIHRVLKFRDPECTLTILNVSSLAAFFPMPYKAVYSASKRFLVDLSMTLREELRSHNVRVMVFCPSSIPTSDHILRKMASQGLMGQVTATDVGRAAARSLDQALAGKALYIPGRINQMLRFIRGLFPLPLRASILRRRWARAYHQYREFLPSFPEKPV